MIRKESIRKFIRIVLYCLNGLLALITIASAYGGMVNPDTTTLPAMMAMTFPLWVGLTILALLINLFAYRMMAIVQGATLLICIGPILSFAPLHLHKTKLSAKEEQRTFTFMSYNVLGLASYANPPKNAKDTSHLVEEFKKGVSNPTLSWVLHQDCDIASLQEFGFGVDRHNLMTPALYDSICKNYPHRTVSNGVGILSKYPIYPVNLRQPEETSGSVVGAIAEIDGHRTLLISVHLQSIGLDSSDRELYREITEGDGGREALKEAKTRLLGKLSTAFRVRARQARMIRSQIDSLGIPNVIICGDFNDIQDSYAMRILARDDFSSAFRKAGRGPIITYYVNRFYFHIDHILYRGHMDAIDFKCYDFKRSDHYPISARFLWEEDAPKVNRNLKGIDLINREQSPSK